MEYIITEMIFNLVNYGGSKIYPICILCLIDSAYNNI